LDKKILWQKNRRFIKCVMVKKKNNWTYHRIENKGLEAAKEDGQKFGGKLPITTLS
jgi:hypothetical protein